MSRTVYSVAEAIAERAKEQGATYWRYIVVIGPNGRELIRVRP